LEAAAALMIGLHVVPYHYHCFVVQLAVNVVVVVLCSTASSSVHVNNVVAQFANNSAVDYLRMRDSATEDDQKDVAEAATAGPQPIAHKSITVHFHGQV
jgi:nitrogen fixation protein FixH